ncbi:MAG: radical SAM protein, partial [Candidatus Falkowbacteria bacterium]|nr:radical SAM protein [Candidatus Falkowbacteria bacterium]
MEEIQYKKFSWNTHKNNWKLKRPNVCQFELTFRCGLNCNYCYASCYNKPKFIKKELNTRQIKLILDKVYDSGVIWLCFTGGDPLARNDFLDVYSYAKDKGFIINIFTNGYSMTKKIADYLGKKPPFVIEITLNGVTKETYEKISGIKGSFNKTIKGLKLILKRKLPLKIKTQIIKDNLEEAPRIREFVENLGLQFRPTTMLHSRLNRDLTPSFLRIELIKILGEDKKFNMDLNEDECGYKVNTTRSTDANIGGPNRQSELKVFAERNNYLFGCSIGGGDGIYIDPYGNSIPCICIREPKVKLLKEGVIEAQKKILTWVKTRHFESDSKC